MIRYSSILLIFFCLSVCAVGCYTVISHPSLVESDKTDKEFLDTHVSHMDDCSSCHESHTKFHQDYTMYYTFPDEQYDFYEWEFYYDTPWWIDPYYIAKNSDQKKTPLPPTQQRDITRRNPNTTTAPTPVHAGPTARSLAKSGSGSNSAAPAQSNSNKRTVSRRNADSDDRRQKKSSSKTSSSTDNDEN